jgi:hypothetical protein
MGVPITSTRHSKTEIEMGRNRTIADELTDSALS